MMGWISRFRRHIVRPECRVKHLVCPNCKSPLVIKTPNLTYDQMAKLHGRELTSEQFRELDGMISFRQVNIKYKCVKCGFVWVEVSSM